MRGAETAKQILRIEINRCVTADVASIVTDGVTDNVTENLTENVTDNVTDKVTDEKPRLFYVTCSAREHIDSAGTAAADFHV